MRLAIVASLVTLVPASARAQQLPAWAFGPFDKPAAANPVLAPRAASTFRSPMNDSVVHWEEYAAFNPAAVVRDGRVVMLYRAEDASGDAEIGHHTSRLGMATSRDGLRFTRRAAPVLYPGRDAQRGYEWPGGVEDPRIVQLPDGRYLLTYTQWNRKTPRLAVATSRDLVHWTKHGPAFARARGGKYRDMETKSGAVVTRVIDGHLVATKIGGRYWMYFDVPHILLASSPDGIDWTVEEGADGKPFEALTPRAGSFDSWLVEAGPPAIVTKDGIVLVYNAGNAERAAGGDSAYPAHVYTAGQALFDARDPRKLLARTDAPSIYPTEPYERTGQYASGTTFAEALIPFRGRWFLYYGMADSRVGVATAEGAADVAPSSPRR